MINCLTEAEELEAKILKFNSEDQSWRSRSQFIIENLEKMIKFNKKDEIYHLLRNESDHECLFLLASYLLKFNVDSLEIYEHIKLNINDFFTYPLDSFAQQLWNDYPEHCSTFKNDIHGHLYYLIKNNKLTKEFIILHNSKFNWRERVRIVKYLLDMNRSEEIEVFSQSLLYRD